jgi:hypothetical protein
MEALGGRLALANSSASGEHDEAASPIVASGMDACVAERDGVMVVAPDDPPDLACVLPEMVTQGAEEQAKVDVEIVSSCSDMELSEVESDRQLTLRELKFSSAPCTIKSSN